MILHSNAMHDFIMRELEVGNRHFAVTMSRQKLVVVGQNTEAPEPGLI